jgi:hypothetical protein
VPPQLEEVHERAAEGGRRIHIHRPDSRSGSTTSWACRGRGPREACVFPERGQADRLVRREGRRRRPPLASTGRDIIPADGGCVRRRRRSVDAVRCGALATPSPISILRRAWKRTPLHHRRAHASISTELMRRLMSQEASSPKIHDELKALFKKLLSFERFNGLVW